jgi:hypothetical protein
LSNPPPPEDPAASEASAAERKPKRGRPKGAKNRAPVDSLADLGAKVKQEALEEAAADETKVGGQLSFT